MKVYGKKIIAALVVVCMMTTTMSAYAFDSALVEQFATGLFGMSENARQEFIDLVELFAEADDSEALEEMYGAGFSALSSSQKSRLYSFSETVKAARIVADYVDEHNVSISKLEKYLGVSGNGSGEDMEEFMDLIMSSESEFEAALQDEGISGYDLSDGFVRMNTAFNLLHDADVLNSYGLSIEFLTADKKYEDLTLSRHVAGTIITLANKELGEDITDIDSAIDALEQMVEDYNALDNGTTDKKLIYKYLNGYGFIEVDKSSEDEDDEEDLEVIDETDIPLGLSDLSNSEFVANTLVTIQSAESSEAIMSLIEEIMTYINDPFSPLGQVEILNAFTIVLEAYQTVDEEENLELLMTDINVIINRLATTTNKFTDLEGFEWAEGYIEFLAAMGFINGESETEFAPSAEITRAEFIAIVVRMFGLTDQGGAFIFTDVPEGEWYYDSVKIAYSNGLISGKTASEFAPMDAINREELATIVGKCLALVEIDETTLTALPFTDSADFSEWSVESAMLVYENNIITGYPDKSFGPKKNATRAEAAKMLFQLYLKM
jgi:hypothetical protein